MKRSFILVSIGLIGVLVTILVVINVPEVLLPGNGDDTISDPNLLVSFSDLSWTIQPVASDVTFNADGFVARADQVGVNIINVNGEMDELFTVFPTDKFVVSYTFTPIVSSMAAAKTWIRLLNGETIVRNYELESGEDFLVTEPVAFDGIQFVVYVEHYIRTGSYPYVSVSFSIRM